ncbi:hypothetical protein [Motilimonas cestriensis]
MKAYSHSITGFINWTITDIGFLIFTMHNLQVVDVLYADEIEGTECAWCS